MSKKWFQKLLPSQQLIKEHSALHFLRPLLSDPNLFHLNRYSVALAFLAGTFLAFFPIPGQMVLAVLVAFLLRCNLPITLALVWITNPVTIPPIFFATYKLGTWLLDTPAMEGMTFTFTWEWLNTELQRVWKPLLVGSLCAGSFFSIVSYTCVKLIWRCRVIYLLRLRKKKRAN